MGYKDDAKALIAKREEIYSKIQENLSVLDENKSTMDSPLVDDEGFPITTIDVYSVRHARNAIVCLRNDRIALRKEMDALLLRIKEREILSRAMDEMPSEILLHVLAKCLPYWINLIRFRNLRTFELSLKVLPLEPDFVISFYDEDSLKIADKFGGLHMSKAEFRRIFSKVNSLPFVDCCSKKRTVLTTCILFFEELKTTVAKFQLSCIPKAEHITRLKGLQIDSLYFINLDRNAQQALLKIAGELSFNQVVIQKWFTTLKELLKSRKSFSATYLYIADRDIYYLARDVSKIKLISQIKHTELLELVEFTFKSSAELPNNCKKIRIGARPPIINRKTLTPFTKVSTVSSGSPASAAGLLVDDQLVQYGSLHHGNFLNTQQLSEVTNANVDKVIRVTVIRNMLPVRLELVPKSWSGKGLVGCRVGHEDTILFF